MKLGITGSRSIESFDFIPYFTLQDREFRAFCRENGLSRRKITAVITGGARGIDTIAFQTAEAIGLRNIQYLPDREKYPGRLIAKACIERNQRIVEDCDLLLAIWDGKSAGTKRTFTYAKKIGKPAFLLLNRFDLPKAGLDSLKKIIWEEEN